MKMKSIYRERETTFIVEGGRGGRKLTAVKSRQGPVFLLVKVGWRKEERLEVKKVS